jgi:hypothetical protein
LFEDKAVIRCWCTPAFGSMHRQALHHDRLRLLQCGTTCHWQCQPISSPTST